MDTPKRRASDWLGIAARVEDVRVSMDCVLGVVKVETITPHLSDVGSVAKDVTEALAPVLKKWSAYYEKRALHEVRPGYEEIRHPSASQPCKT